MSIEYDPGPEGFYGHENLYFKNKGRSVGQLIGTEFREGFCIPQQCYRNNVFNANYIGVGVKDRPEGFDELSNFMSSKVGELASRIAKNGELGKDVICRVFGYRSLIPVKSTCDFCIEAGRVCKCDSLLAALLYERKQILESLDSPTDPFQINLERNFEVRRVEKYVPWGGDREDYLPKKHTLGPILTLPEGKIQFLSPKKPKINAKNKIASPSSSSEDSSSDTVIYDRDSYIPGLHREIGYCYSCKAVVGFIEGKCTAEACGMDFSFVPNSTEGSEFSRYYPRFHVSVKDQPWETRMQDTISGLFNENECIISNNIFEFNPEYADENCKISEVARNFMQGTDKVSS